VRRDDRQIAHILVEAAGDRARRGIGREEAIGMHHVGSVFPSAERSGERGPPRHAFDHIED